MLVNMKESRNWSAVSALNVSEGTGDPVMYMTGAYNGKDLNFTTNIQNTELYIQNKKDVDADYEAFRNKIFSEIGNEL